MDIEIERVLGRHHDQLERAVDGLKAKLVKSAEEYEKLYVKLRKVKQTTSQHG